MVRDLRAASYKKKLSKARKSRGGSSGGSSQRVVVKKGESKDLRAASYRKKLDRYRRDSPSIKKSEKFKALERKLKESGEWDDTLEREAILETKVKQLNLTEPTPELAKVRNKLIKTGEWDKSLEKQAVEKQQEINRQREIEQQKQEQQQKQQTPPPTRIERIKEQPTSKTQQQTSEVKDMRLQSYKDKREKRLSNQQITDSSPEPYGTVAGGINPATFHTSTYYGRTAQTEKEAPTRVYKAEYQEFVKSGATPIPERLQRPEVSATTQAAYDKAYAQQIVDWSESNRAKYGDFVQPYLMDKIKVAEKRGDYKSLIGFWQTAQEMETLRTEKALAQRRKEYYDELTATEKSKLISATEKQDLKAETQVWSGFAERKQTEFKQDFEKFKEEYLPQLTEAEKKRYLEAKSKGRPEEISFWEQWTTTKNKEYQREMEFRKQVYETRKKTGWEEYKDVRKYPEGEKPPAYLTSIMLPPEKPERLKQFEKNLQRNRWYNEFKESLPKNWKDDVERLEQTFEVIAPKMVKAQVTDYYNLGQDIINKEVIPYSRGMYKILKSSPELIDLTPPVVIGKQITETAKGVIKGRNIMDTERIKANIIRKDVQEVKAAYGRDDDIQETAKLTFLPIAYSTGSYGLGTATLFSLNIFDEPRTEIADYLGKQAYKRQRDFSDKFREANRILSQGKESYPLKLDFGIFGGGKKTVNIPKYDLSVKRTVKATKEVVTGVPDLVYGTGLGFATSFVESPLLMAGYLKAFGLISDVGTSAIIKTTSKVTQTKYFSKGVLSRISINPNFPAWVRTGVETTAFGSYYVPTYIKAPKEIKPAVGLGMPLIIVGIAGSHYALKKTANIKGKYVFPRLRNIEPTLGKIRNLWGREYPIVKLKSAIIRPKGLKEKLWVTKELIIEPFKRQELLLKPIGARPYDVASIQPPYRKEYVFQKRLVELIPEKKLLNQLSDLKYENVMTIGNLRARGIVKRGLREVYDKQAIGGSLAVSSLLGKNTKLKFMDIDTYAWLKDMDYLVSHWRNILRGSGVQYRVIPRRVKFKGKPDLVSGAEIFIQGKNVMSIHAIEQFLAPTFATVSRRPVYKEFFRLETGETIVNPMLVLRRKHLGGYEKWRSKPMGRYSKDLSFFTQAVEEIAARNWILESQNLAYSGFFKDFFIRPKDLGRTMQVYEMTQQIPELLSKRKVEPKPYRLRKSEIKFYEQKLSKLKNPFQQTVVEFTKKNPDLAIGGSTGIFLQLQGKFRDISKKDIDLYLFGKRGQEKYAQSILKRVNQKSQEMFGESIYVLEGKTIKINKRLKNAKEYIKRYGEKLTDINYAREKDVIQTIQGVKFLSYKDILRDKEMILKFEPKTKPKFKKAKQDVPLIRRGEEELIKSVVSEKPITIKRYDEKALKTLIEWQKKYKGKTDIKSAFTTIKDYGFPAKEIRYGEPFSFKGSLGKIKGKIKINIDKIKNIKLFKKGGLKFTREKSFRPKIKDSYYNVKPDLGKTQKTFPDITTSYQRDKYYPPIMINKPIGYYPPTTIRQPNKTFYPPKIEEPTEPYIIPPTYKEPTRTFIPKTPDIDEPSKLIYPPPIEIIPPIIIPPPPELTPPELTPPDYTPPPTFPPIRQPPTPDRRFWHLRVPEKEKEKKKVAGYNTFVKEYGKFKKANKQMLPEKEAINLGMDIVDNSPSASFKVQRAKIRKRIPRSRRRKFRTGMPINPYKFRRDRKNNSIYIEKKKFRIDTFGERTGITMTGLTDIRRLEMQGLKRIGKGGLRKKINRAKKISKPNPINKIGKSKSIFAGLSNLEITIHKENKKNRKKPKKKKDFDLMKL